MLPAALGAYLLVQIMIFWVVDVKLLGFFELPSWASAFISSFVSNFVGAYLFVAVGAGTAPRWRFVTSIILALLHAVVLIAATASLAAESSEPPSLWLPALGCAIGVAASIVPCIMFYRMRSIDEERVFVDDLRQVVRWSFSEILKKISHVGGAIFGVVVALFLEDWRDVRESPPIQVDGLDAIRNRRLSAAIIDELLLDLIVDYGVVSSQKEVFIDLYAIDKGVKVRANCSFISFEDYSSKPWLLLDRIPEDKDKAEMSKLVLASHPKIEEGESDGSTRAILTITRCNGDIVDAVPVGAEASQHSIEFINREGDYSAHLSIEEGAGGFYVLKFENVGSAEGGSTASGSSVVGDRL